MSTALRLTARLAVVASFAALFAAACSPDSNGPSSPALLAHRQGGGGAAAPGFTVLGQAAVSCSGGSITGSVGTFQPAPPAGPGAITLVGCPVSGSQDIGDATAVAAFNAFVAQYDALAPKAGDVCTTLSGTLAGVTLSPGVYCFPAAAALTGTLTLSGPANGTWIFKIGTPGPSGTGALTGTDFSVVMAGGAQACNVTWWVSQAATMTRAAFLGNILAGAAISMSAGTLNGNAWAGAKADANGVRVGDVTFTEGTTVVGCGATAVPPSCKFSGDRVTGGGWITGKSGAKANFAVAGGIKHDAFWGHLEYDDKGLKGKSDDFRVKGTGVTAYGVLDNVSRRIEGTAKVNGAAGFTYRVDVSDNGEPGRNDRFAISLWDGEGTLVYSVPSSTLGGGNIQLHKSHGGACKEHDGDKEHDDGDNGDDHEGD